MNMVISPINSPRAEHRSRMSAYETPEQREARRRNPYSRTRPSPSVTVLTSLGPTSSHGPAYTGPVIARTHTENHTYGNRTHRTTMRITRPFAPGCANDPAAAFNCDAYCSDMQLRLWKMEQTTRAVDGFNQALMQGQLSAPGAEDLTYSMRAAINRTLADQMDFFVKCADGFGLTREIKELREEADRMGGAAAVLHIPVQG